MRAELYIGRIGGLAVALGVGAALVIGPVPAWAEPGGTDGSTGAASSSSSSESDASSRSAASTPDTGSDTGSDSKPDSKPDSPAEPEADRDPEPQTEAEPQTTANEPAPAPAAGVAEPDEGETAPEDTTPLEPAPEDTTPLEPAPEDTTPPDTTPPDTAPPDTAPPDTAPADVSDDSASDARPATHPHTVTTPDAAEPAALHTDSALSRSVSEPDVEQAPVVQVLAAAEPATAAALPSAPSEPAVPGLRPWPTAFDPLGAVSYLTGLVTTVVSAVLSPFAAGLPAGPVAPPTLWTLLAWVRRELFNESPTIAYNPALTEQTLNPEGDVVVTGNVGAEDVDGHELTYTVVGRPLNGGTVTVDADGDFTYRPMNAMAAVGGWDQFTVVVSDETAGLHLHGPLGLLQFVPILGGFLNPGEGHRVARTITVGVTPTAGIDVSMPDDFAWGVAHAGFQAEGGPGSPVDPNSDWYRWVHDPINQLLGLTRGVPEDGPGAYVLYDSDAALARDELGMNTFRMSIEWSRIFSESTAGIDITDEGGTISLADLQAMDALADQDEVAHYADVLASLRAHGLEPMVTVTHFALPVWVHDPIAARPLVQLGLPAPAAGWLSPTTSVEFGKYAAYLAWKYGDDVDNWATINEPFPPVLTEFFAIPGVVPSWPPGVIRPDLASTFLVNQAKGHVAAYDAIHAWDDDAFVGFTNNMIPARPANPVSELDVQAADAWNAFYNNWFPQAVVNGWVDANFDGVQTPDEVHADYVDKVDFIGVQYYGSQPMTGFGVAPVPGFPFLRGIPIRCDAASDTCSDFNQPIDPGGFREVLEVAASYGKPLWITENGIADDEDTKRPGYIVNHIAVVQDLVAHGTDIRGYTYWSFVDNLEWSEGYHLQFGLYGSDPTTPELERTPKPASISALSQITGANGLPLLLLGQYVPSL